MSGLLNAPVPEARKTNDFRHARLLAHELTHVVQQSGGGRPLIQRSLDGCADLIKNPSIVSIVSGRVVHNMITADFKSQVADAWTPLAGTVPLIPGAGAAPLRSQEICGGDSKQIIPQTIGGNAGAGFPDLARLGTGGVLQVAEIKPAVVPCLIEGEEQELRYIEQGNARDQAQQAWRTAQGITVVSPMLPSAYTPPTVVTPTFQIKTAWCSPGLLGYQVSARGVPVRSRERATEKKKQEDKSEQRGSVPSAQPAPALARGQAIALIVAFVKTLVETQAKDIDAAVTAFVHEHPGLAAFIITAGVAAIIAIVADDLSLVGILDDVAIPPIIVAMWRVATAM